MKRPHLSADEARKLVETTPSPPPPPHPSLLSHSLFFPDLFTFFGSEESPPAPPLLLPPYLNHCRSSFFITIPSSFHFLLQIESLSRPPSLFSLRFSLNQRPNPPLFLRRNPKPAARRKAKPSIEFQEDLNNFCAIPFGSCVKSSHKVSVQDLKKTEEALLSIASQAGYAGFNEERFLNYLKGLGGKL